MYKLLNLVLVFALYSTSIQLFAQKFNLDDYGLNQLMFEHEGDSVHIIVQRKKGEEQLNKPLFFFCQGSLPQPLIKYSEQGMYGIFPFSTTKLLEDFHLVIVGKPGIPLKGDVNKLGRNFMYIDKEGKVPQAYIQRNLLNYYLKRNLAIIDYLVENEWVSKEKMVVAGHSEGSRIAVRMAEKSQHITHLIYASGNPYGRIVSMVSQNRRREVDTTKYTVSTFAYWEKIINDPDNMEATTGDTYKATYQFSEPSVDIFKHLKIPILVSYGTKDESAPYIDLLRIEMIRAKKENIIFHDYIGLDHNFFPLLPDGKPDYSVFTWDKVADDWRMWLEARSGE